MANKVKANFNTLRPLVLMQLKDKIDFSYLKSRKQTIFKFVLNTALFIVLTAVIYLIFYLIVQFQLFSYALTLNFNAFLVLMTLVFFFFFLSCLTQLTNTLYFAKDNQVLLTLPTSSNQVFTSKLIVVLFYEILKAISYLLPFFVAYGLVMHLAIGYYLWAILTTVFATIVMVVLSGLFSIPAMVVGIWLRKYRTLRITLLVLVVILSVILMVKGISMIPTSINLVGSWNIIKPKINDFINNFALKFAPINYFLSFMTGMRYNSLNFSLADKTIWLTLVISIVIILISLTLTYVLTRPLFFKMASSPFEFKKKNRITNKKNSYHWPLISIVKIELKKTIRTSNIVYTLLAVCIIAPIAVMFENQIISAMDTRMMGNNMCLVFNVLIVLLIMMSANVSIASVYSREGNSAYENKVNPAHQSTLLFGKILFYLILTNLSIIVSVLVMNFYSHLSIWNTFALMLSMILVNTAHAFWSAELDIMNPQHAQYQTTGTHAKNPNEAKSTVIAFITAFVFATIMFFLISESIKLVFTKMLIISAIYFALRAYLYFTRIKLYYKEK